MKQYVARALAFAASVTFVIVAFQNCQDFKVSDEVLASEYQIQNHAAQDVSTHDKLMALEELVGEYVSDRARYTGTTFEKVANLHATLFSPGSVFDLTAKTPTKVPVPSHDAVRNRAFLTQTSDAGGAVVLQTAGTDTLIADEFSVLLVLKAPTSGQVLTIGTGTALAQEIGLTITGDQVIAHHASSAGNVAKVTGLIEGDPEVVVIGASFGVAPGRLLLMVNGRVFDQIETTGSPANLTLVQRTVEIGATAAGGNITWGAVRLFAKRLGPFDLSVLSRKFASTWQVPNVSDDISLRTMVDRSVVDFDEEEPVTDPRFAAAQAALEAKCATCHYHSSWNGKNASFYFSSALVVKGSPDNSPLYYRMSATTSPALTGSKNMPLGTGPAVTQAEVDAIRDWIQNAP